MSNNKKVYCNDCKHQDNYISQCNYPDNICDNAMGPGKGRIKNIFLINTNNNCEWFEQRISVWVKLVNFIGIL